MQAPAQLSRSGLAGASLLLILLSCLTIIMGSIGPWVTSDVAAVSAGGLEKDGPILIVIVILIAAQLAFSVTRGLKRRWTLILPVLLAALCVLIGFADLSDISGSLGVVEPGWGLRAAAYASVALLIGTVLLAIGGRRGAPVHNV